MVVTGALGMSQKPAPAGGSGPEAFHGPAEVALPAPEGWFVFTTLDHAAGVLSERSCCCCCCAAACCNNT